MKMKCLLTFILCLFLVGLVMGGEIYVSPGTDKISAALLTANPGDVLVLEAGTYTETKTLKTPAGGVTMRGKLGQTIFEMAYSEELVKFDNDDKLSVVIIVEGDFRVENVIFKTDSVGRCIVNGYGSVKTGEEHIVEKNNIFVDHCEFHNFSDPSATPIWIPDPEVMLDGKAHPVDTLCVTNSLFYNSGYQGIRGETNQTHVFIAKNCTFWNLYRENIKVYGNETIPDYMEYLVDHCTFYNSTGTDTKGHGTYFRHTGTADTIRNCIYYKLSGNGITCRAEGAYNEMTIERCIADICAEGAYNSNVRPMLRLCLEEDPMFTDPDNGDFSFQEGSLAIGFATDGTDCGNPITDWSHVLSTGIEYEKSKVVPTTFCLDQNYPNPFNPMTTISYSVNKTDPVTLDIFNMKGQKIRTLVNEVKDTGSYSIIWDARDGEGQALAGGVYLYRLKSGSAVEIRKMALIK
ncbi:MAG: DUF5123 domain-containing protein [bacterium]|nr:MAG: DUF5123 domain-containing protein [bacterium]